MRDTNRAPRFRADPTTEPLAEWEKELLGVTPRKIEFNDIQQGDHIKAVRPTQGVTITREGVADTKAGQRFPFWHTAEHGLVADSAWPEATYTLMERPEPPKPNPFKVAGVGSLAAVGSAPYLKKADGKWYAIVSGGTPVFWGHTDETLFGTFDSKVTYSA